MFRIGDEVRIIVSYYDDRFVKNFTGRINKIADDNQIVLIHFDSEFESPWWVPTHAIELLNKKNSLNIKDRINSYYNMLYNCKDK